MGARRHIWILIVFVVHDYLGEAFLKDEEKLAKKYIAEEDTSLLLNVMHLFDESYGDDWVIMPDGNGTARKAVLRSTETNENNPGKTFFGGWSEEEIPKHTYFLLFTKNAPEGIRFTNENLTAIPFDSSKPTKLVTHGWKSTSEDEVVSNIKKAYLEESDVNVIGLDWSYFAYDDLYVNSADVTKLVGRYAASITDALVENYNGRHSDFHFIGHSLGAHVVGFAGNGTSKKVKRITGLDPALPGFQYVAGPEGRLDSSDAEFVDVIHTCAGILGMSSPVGHADFYPNGGSPFQPGCRLELIPTAAQSCSHSRAHEYFTESIRSAEFKAVRCDDWDHFKKNQCDDTFFIMGEKVKPDAAGIFYLKTDNNSPFALGLDGIRF